MAARTSSAQTCTLLSQLVMSDEVIKDEWARVANVAFLPNATGTKHRLQLNCYRWIFQKYFDQRVSKMLIVCLHPEHPTAWVDEVPVMEAEVDSKMRLQREQCTNTPDVCGGSTSVSCSVPDVEQRLTDLTIFTTAICCFFCLSQVCG